MGVTFRAGNDTILPKMVNSARPLNQCLVLADKSINRPSNNKASRFGRKHNTTKGSGSLDTPRVGIRRGLHMLERHRDVRGAGQDESKRKRKERKEKARKGRSETVASWGAPEEALPGAANRVKIESKLATSIGKYLYDEASSHPVQLVLFRVSFLYSLSFYSHPHPLSRGHSLLCSLFFL